MPLEDMEFISAISQASLISFEFGKLVGIQRETAFSISSVILNAVKDLNLLAIQDSSPPLSLCSQALKEVIDFPPKIILRKSASIHSQLIQCSCLLAALDHPFEPSLQTALIHKWPIAEKFEVINHPPMGAFNQVHFILPAKGRLISWVD